MNTKAKIEIKTIILLGLGIWVSLTPIFITSNNFNEKNRNKIAEYRSNFNHEYTNPKISATSGKIHIYQNWSAAKIAGICTGSGTEIDPYLIKDLIIDAEGSGSCILIEFTNTYFKIENCTLYNSGSSWDQAGIRLNGVNNGQIIDNYCYSNSRGIWIFSSSDNVIRGNIIRNNHYGIELRDGNYNTISGNVVNRSRVDGITIVRSISNNFSNNIINGGCFRIWGYSLQHLISNNVEPTNLVNGKPIYYYTNEINLGPSNFTNAGQIILANCSNSIISNVNISQIDSRSSLSNGISLYFCNNNTLMENDITDHFCGIWIYQSYDILITRNELHHNYWGLYLEESFFNSILKNNPMYNEYGIMFMNSYNNTISNNTVRVNYRGIYFSSSEYNIISNNTVENQNWGIYLSSSDLNTISGNVLRRNGNGLYFYYSHSNEISGNTINDNYRGIYFYRECDNNSITGNSANFNSWGIMIFSNSENNEILGNTVTSNVFNGIHLYYSNHNFISGNTANFNSRGIFLDTSNSTIILNNIARNNSIAGIYLNNSDANHIWMNKIINNSYGIYLSYSNYNYIMINSFERNKICIVEVNCSGNVFYDNEACPYGQKDDFSYELILFILLIFAGLVLGGATLLLFKYKKRRK